MLAIDLDPQGNTTSGFGIDKVRVKDTVYHLLVGLSEVDECIQKNIHPNLSLITSNFDLAGAEIELIMASLQEHQIKLEKIFLNLKKHMENIKDEYGKEEVIPNFSLILSNFDLAGNEIKTIMQSIQEHQMELDKIFVMLREHIEKVKDDYDYVIIDCPPSLGILTGNAMAASDTVLVPIQCEYYALEGLSQVIDTTNRIKRWLNPRLEIEGVVFTMYDSRTNLSLQVVENVKENLQRRLFLRMFVLRRRPATGCRLTSMIRSRQGRRVIGSWRTR